jgi:hypothetical protein
MFFLFYCEQVEVPEKEATFIKKQFHKTAVKILLNFTEPFYMAVLFEVCHLQVTHKITCDVIK